MKSLSESIAIVTGASRGIGRAIAQRLAKEGARVIAVARNSDALESLCADNESIEPSPCDVSNEAEVETVVSSCLEAHGRIDILINNAGIGSFGPISEISYHDFRRVMEVNAGGTFLFSRAVLPGMKKRKDGDIINIASVVAVKGYPDQSAYAASKHAVLGLTKSLAAETQADGIRVRSICPGGVDTDLIGLARPDLDRSSLMQPEDIAELLIFLLTATPGAIIDNINVRRPGSPAWF